MPETMGKWDIAFPNVSIYLENVPKSINIFGIEIAFYGMILALGVLFGFLMILREAKITGQNPDTYWDFALYAIFFSICGSRIYYVAFSWDQYKDNLLEIINLRNGGIAIYGTVIAGFTTLFVYAFIKKLSPFLMADTCVLGLLVGQIIGRYGNFMNREAFGEYSNHIFAMRLPIEAVRQNEITQNMLAHVGESNYIQVHPTFLYESLWNVMILVLIMLYRKHKRFTGEIALLYLAGYGLGRIWIEGLRTDQLIIGNTGIAVSQVLAGVMVVVSIVIDIVVRIYLRKSGDRLDGREKAPR